MQKYYHSLDQVSVECPMSWLNYIELAPFIYALIVFSVVLLFVKFLNQSIQSYRKYRNTTMIFFMVGSLALLAVQSVDYFEKYSQFREDQVRSNILAEHVIYKIKKDRPYTLSESDLMRTNDAETLETILDETNAPKDVYRKNFNLMKRAILAAEMRSDYEMAIESNDLNDCDKDAVNDLYRCHVRILNHDGSRTFANVMVYKKPRFYQDYLRYGFRENTEMTN